MERIEYEIYEAVAEHNHEKLIECIQRAIVSAARSIMDSCSMDCPHGKGELRFDSFEIFG